MSRTIGLAGAAVAVLAAILSCVVLTTEPACAAWSDVRIRLDYEPAERNPFEDPSAVGFLGGRVVRIEAIADAGSGDDPAVIGSRASRRGEDGRITTKDDVPAFIASALAQTLADWGANIADDQAPDFVLRVGVEELAIAERAQVDARLAVRIQLATIDGLQLWEGLVAGKGTGPDEGHRETQYNAAVSTALTDVVRQLATHPGLAWAVARARRDEPAARTGAASEGPLEEPAAPGEITRAARGGMLAASSGVPLVTQRGAGGAPYIATAVPGGGAAAAPSATITNATLAAAPAAPPPAAEPDEAPKSGRSALVDELLRLTEAGADEETLTLFARQRAADQDLSAADVLELKQAGIPDAVIRAALEAGGR